METDERTSSIEPAGVMATACTHRRPEATREAPAEIAVGINWQLARDSLATNRVLANHKSRITAEGRRQKRPDLNSSQA
jgi:hypothetical protein